MDWYLMVWRRYAEFSGRSRRKEYWMFTLINSLIMLALIVVPMAGIFLIPGIKNDWNGWIGGIGGIGIMLSVPFALYCLALIVPGIAVGVRRFHDTGKSGWLLLLFVVLGMIPIINIVVIIIQMVILCLDSDPGPNQYGPSPKYSEMAGMAAGYASHPAMGLGVQPQPFIGESNFGYCKGCGAKFTNAATFCAHCGTKV